MGFGCVNYFALCSGYTAPSQIVDVVGPYIDYWDCYLNCPDF
jgi:hypothetical protein